MKLKPKSAKAARRAAQLFLWHLRPPWREHFMHDHWWKGNAEQAPRVAAVWEVLRRHLKSKRLRASNAEPRNDLEWFIVEHGLKSWPKLATAERTEWRRAVAELPPQRGFDPRPLYSVTAQSVDWKSGVHPGALLSLDPKVRGRARANAEGIREEEIQRLVTEHHRAGRVIIAIEPDITDLDEAVRAFKACYAQHRRKTKKGKSRVADWLNVIQDFETAELRSPKPKGDDQLAARYRRVLRWRWC